jgi:hypothetical protein
MAWMRGKYLRLVPAPAEHAAGQEIDDQVAWVWI